MRPTRNSVMPTREESLSLESRKAPAAVAVHCAVGGLCAPYSVGARNCLSAARLCDVVSVATLLYDPRFNMAEAKRSDSVQVEQAP